MSQNDHNQEQASKRSITALMLTAIATIAGIIGYLNIIISAIPVLLRVPLTFYLIGLIFISVATYREIKIKKDQLTLSAVWWRIIKITGLAIVVWTLIVGAFTALFILGSLVFADRKVSIKGVVYETFRNREPYENREITLYHHGGDKKYVNTKDDGTFEFGGISKGDFEILINDIIADSGTVNGNWDEILNGIIDVGPIYIDQLAPSTPTIPSDTPTGSTTQIATNTATEAASATQTATNTATEAASATQTATNTATEAASATQTATNTATETASATQTATNTPTTTATATPLSTATDIATLSEEEDVYAQLFKHPNSFDFAYTELISKQNYFDCYLADQDDKTDISCPYTSPLLPELDDFTQPLGNISWQHSANYCKFIGAELPYIDEIAQIIEVNITITNKVGDIELEWVLDKPDKGYKQMVLISNGKFARVSQIAGQTYVDVGFRCVRRNK